ncbi:MAG: DUF2851 family protein [Candidatus Hydrogenedentes bacterium]|nr:DUF2851 family protein [Candidatus Hydrogenedentota bacterium]
MRARVTKPMTAGAATNSVDDARVFRDAYARLVTVAREGKRAVSEQIIQAIWYDQLFDADALVTTEGQRVRIVSPGWWNHSEGPDFRGAQIEFGGTTRTGDIEIHLDHAAWRAHGHHLDPRYDNVLLVVVLEPKPPAALPLTSTGRAVPCLLLGNYVDESIYNLPDLAEAGNGEVDVSLGRGYCAGIAQAHGAGRVRDFVMLAGEWRMLNKARAIRERMDRVGVDQAVYEAFLTACGYSRYKHHFRAIAQQLPHERVVQLAKHDAFLVEAAFFQLAGLLPDALPEGTTAVPHFARLRALRRDHLSGLRSIPLTWKRVGVRPNNYPERRLSGAARFLARTSRAGLWESLNTIWRAENTVAARRRALENLFPDAMGFWAEHCTWTGKRLAKPVATLGAARVRAIIGNVFLPAALAVARRERDRSLEERALEFFAAMPKESENHVVKRMLPRVFGDAKPGKVNFRLQQGLLQVYQDWCESNPSCRGCPIIGHLDPEGTAKSQTGNRMGPCGA